MAIAQMLTAENVLFENSGNAGMSHVFGTNAPVLGVAFDDTASEDAHWKLATHEYASGNLRFRITWHAENATTGTFTLGIQLSALTPNTDTTSIEARTFGTLVEITDTHLGTTSERTHSFDIDLDSAAELNNLAADDEAIIRAVRNISDSMANDAIIDKIEVFEI